MQRWQGCLIGQCLGDALGFVVEGYPPRECRSYVDDVLRVGRAGELGRAGYPFGQYTDDSQLLREMLQSFVARGHWDPADYARRVGAIFVEDRIVGRGRATEEAALRLAAGTPWEEAGTPPPSAGNGSAMRAAGAALMQPANREVMATIAHDQGRITHQDRRCSAGAAAIAAAVARGLRGEPVAVDAFCNDVAAMAERFDAGFADTLRRLPEWVALAPEQAAAPIATLGADPEVGQTWHGISPFVIPSVVWSLYSFLRTPDDYWETVCTAIAVGGDVDTTAAMAGAISGAHLGLDAIPEPLASKLHDQGTWRYGDLLGLAVQVCDIAM